MIAGAERQRLRQEAEKLSDAALAQKFDVSVNTISRTLHKERRRM
jgi:transcriptional regulator with XRE-family HTH domain